VTSIPCLARSLQTLFTTVADEVARELAALSVRLHALLVKTGLRGAIGH